MKGRTIILDHLGEVEAAALIVDGELEDILVDHDAPRPGTIYRAIADRPIKGQGGMFLKTPDGQAFLRQVKGLAPGQPILVQVTGYAEPGKATPVTAKILFKSRYVIVTPDAPGINISRRIKDDEERDRILEAVHVASDAPAYGLILRSSCDQADTEDIAQDVAQMLELAEKVMHDKGQEMEVLAEGDGPHLLAWREWTEPADVVTSPGGFADLAVLEALDDTKNAKVPLPNGASFFIEPTRALIAVDVNTGRDIALAAGLKANLACAKTLPRALRLRGLGGQITMDLAPMPKKDRRTFENTLRAAFRADDIETALVGWTPLGHFELQRKRARLPLTEVLK